MPRGRKKKEINSDSTGTMTVEPMECVAVAPDKGELHLEEPPFEPTGTYVPTADETEPARFQPRGRFRSWVNDTDRGYSRLTDIEQRKIVLTFGEKPPSDVLTAVKDGGFQFKPDYAGVKNAWVRFDDHQGRIQAEAIDSMVRSLIPGRSSPEL